MKQIRVYLLLTFLISWFFWGVRILAQNDLIPSFFSMVGPIGVFGPFIAFIVIKKREGRQVWLEIKKMFHIRSSKGIIFFSIMSPIVLSLIAYLLLLQNNQASFELGLTLQMIPLVGVIILVTGGPLEEFGWRGYLLPKIRNSYGFLVTAGIIGLIHGLWHLPLHFTEGTVQEVIPVSEYIAITILGAVSYSFIFEYTKSITPMIILHWLSNLSSAVFVYWQDSYGRYMLFVITIVLDVVLVLYYRKRHRQLT